MSPTPLRRARRSLVWQQTPLLAGLVLLWMLLWGELSPLALVSGVVLAFLVTRAFYLPPVELSGRFHLGWALLFLGRFAVQLVTASFQVALAALGRARHTVSSIIAVRLRTRSDFIITLTSIAISLIPGSLVVEVDRSRAILYLHVLATGSLEDVERMRRQVLATEALIVRVLGSAQDVRRTS